MSSSLTSADLVDVTMPQMGVSVAEGTVVAWRVEVGDRIEAEQTICEISTDKIDTEVPAPVSGVVAEILVDVDQTVEVGVVLARIAVGDGAVTAPSTPDGPVTPGADTAAAPADEPAAPASDEPSAAASDEPAASRSRRARGGSAPR